MALHLPRGDGWESVMWGVSLGRRFAIVFFLGLSMGYANAADRGYELRLKEAYEDAIFSESLGQVPDAKRIWRQMIEQVPADHRYARLAAAKLCQYDKANCPAAAKPSLWAAFRQKVSDWFFALRNFTLLREARQVESLLAGIDGVSVKIVSRRLVLDGKLISLDDLRRVDAVAAHMGEAKVTNLVTLSPLIQKKIAHAIAFDINNPQITVRNVNGLYILEGTADSLGERLRAHALAEAVLAGWTRGFGQRAIQSAFGNKPEIVNLVNIRPLMLARRAHSGGRLR